MASWFNGDYEQRQAPGADHHNRRHSSAVHPLRNAPYAHPLNLPPAPLDGRQSYPPYPAPGPVHGFHAPVYPGLPPAGRPQLRPMIPMGYGAAPLPYAPALPRHYPPRLRGQLIPPRPQRYQTSEQQRFAPSPPRHEAPFPPRHGSPPRQFYPSTAYAQEPQRPPPPLVPIPPPPREDLQYAAGCSSWRVEQFEEEVHIGTPCAAGELRADPSKLAKATEEEFGEDWKQRQYLANEFQKMELKLRVETSAKMSTIKWSLPPALEAMRSLVCFQFFRQEIELFYKNSHTKQWELDNAVNMGQESVQYEFESTPGTEYKATLKIADMSGKMLVEIEKEFRAIFSTEEHGILFYKAIAFSSTNRLQPFTHLYRCKPGDYWTDIYRRTGGYMDPYMKDDNGQAASPINGRLYGLFWSALRNNDGSIPDSPFGDTCYKIWADELLRPDKVNFYFADFYCNEPSASARRANGNRPQQHYVTIVICQKGSIPDKYCSVRLRNLNPATNHFLTVVPCFTGPRFYVNTRVWVEVYFTERVNVRYYELIPIGTKGAGTARIGGIKHNKFCKDCNLYPLEPPATSTPPKPLAASFEARQDAETPQSSEAGHGDYSSLDLVDETYDYAHENDTTSGETSDADDTLELLDECVAGPSSSCFSFSDVVDAVMYMVNEVVAEEEFFEEEDVWDLDMSVVQELKDEEIDAFFDDAENHFNRTGERLSAAHDLTLNADDEIEILGL
ncbi:Protein Y92H12BR.7 [Aphelenchoides avenae]|nr:Protein Y92H12BR.7 [Aphelenchus avenae]